MIDQTPRTLSEEDRATLRDLARMVEQELAALQLAIVDEVTKLANRRGFDDTLGGQAHAADALAGSQPDLSHRGRHSSGQDLQIR